MDIEDQYEPEEEFLSTTERAAIIMELLDAQATIQVKARRNDLTLEVFGESFLLSMLLEYRNFQPVARWIVSPLSQIDRNPFPASTLEIAVARCIEIALKH